MAETPKPEQLLDIKHSKVSMGFEKGWLRTAPDVEIKPGMHCFAGEQKNLEAVGMPNARHWSASDEDWKIPENWKEIILEGFKDRLGRFRSLQLFMDICVRCGACADKCHYFIGSGDPKNMPVLRAELLRSVYRKHFTAAGKVLGPLGAVAGARELTYDVLKEWWYYLYQCSECRRCSVFCPYGIDTAEITIMGRELTNLLGLNIDWIAGPVANCNRTGNHLGIMPHAYKEMMEFFVDELEDVTGVRAEPSFNRKGAEILFITPSGDVFADPGTYTAMGYLALFQQLGLDITWSTYASEGGNFGFFTSNEIMKKLNAKMYAEAKRLGVKWILGGECGHMWRVINQYMGTMNLELAEGSNLEDPVSPITGTRFENAKSTKMVHITEFTADLIRNNKLKFNPSRNDNKIVTFHDSCNTSRGMGLFEEPRYIINNVCNHFYEMPPNCIREQTFCCGSGSGLNAGEDMELRMRGGLPRANAVKYVHEKYGVNMLANICAIDRAALPPLMKYWVPQVDVTGLHELVANAMIMDGEKERTTDFRGNPLPGMEEAEDV